MKQLNGVELGECSVPLGLLTSSWDSVREALHIYIMFNATGVGICGLEAKSISIKVNEIPALRFQIPISWGL